MNWFLIIVMIAVIVITFISINQNLRMIKLIRNIEINGKKIVKEKIQAKKQKGEVYNPSKDLDQVMKGRIIDPFD